MIKTILVTGGAGYVGAVLISKLLKNNYTVKVLDWYLYDPHVFDSFKKDRKIIEIKGDIRNKKLVQKSLKGTDAVIHLACVSNDPSFELNPHFGKSVNYDATIQLINLAREARVKRFIYASTSSVYGVKKEKEFTEDLILEPLTDYSKYKALCEPYLISKGSDSFTVFIIRPATICGYSPRMRLDLTVNMLTIQSLVNKKITVFGGSQKRPNIHIEDMTDLYINSLSYPKAKIHKKIYNAGYENKTVREIAEMVKKITNDEKVKIVYLPSNDLRSYHISAKKIAKELGFKPKHSVEEAIRDIKKAYIKGLIPRPFSNPNYWNVKKMKEMFKDN